MEARQLAGPARAGALRPRADAFNDEAKLVAVRRARRARTVQEKQCRERAGLRGRHRQDPEILGEKITKPLFVLGLPRTGTTLLQRLLSHARRRPLPAFLGSVFADPRARRCAHFWCSGRPRRWSLRRGQALACAARLGRAGVQQDPSHRVSTIRRNATTCSARTSSCRRASTSAGCRATGTGSARRRMPMSIRMHKRQLQVLQWLDRRQHWVLKLPQSPLGHSAAARHLSRCAHRLYPSRSAEDHRLAVQPDRGHLEHDVGSARSAPGSGFRPRTAQRCQEAGRTALQTIPRDQIMHVEYDELVTDPVAMAQTVYERFGYPRDPGTRGKDARLARRASEQQARRAPLRAERLRPDRGGGAAGGWRCPHRRPRAVGPALFRG